MGGGGFSMEPENLALDRYVWGLAGKTRPKVCFVPTAGGDQQDYINRFYASWAELDCVPTHLSLFKPPATDLRAFVFEQDIIYVGGGNTRNLLVLWKEWGLDEILREAWQAGRVLAGVSAGSICWFEQGITDATGRLSVLPCLGFLRGSNCPHYDAEAERRPTYRAMITAGQIGPGYAADDGAALHFVGTTLEKIVGSRPQAKAYWLEREGDGYRETPLEPVYLGR